MTPAERMPSAETQDPRPRRGPAFWLAAVGAVLAVLSGAAILIMLLSKWATGGGAVWPWFTRFSYIALPTAFLLLVAAMVVTALTRRRA